MLILISSEFFENIIKPCSLKISKRCDKKTEAITGQTKVGKYMIIINNSNSLTNTHGRLFKQIYSFKNIV